MINLKYSQFLWFSDLRGIMIKLLIRNLKAAVFLFAYFRKMLPKTHNIQDWNKKNQISPFFGPVSLDELLRWNSFFSLIWAAIQWKGVFAPSYSKEDSYFIKLQQIAVIVGFILNENKEPTAAATLLRLGLLKDTSAAQQMQFVISNSRDKSKECMDRELLLFSVFELIKASWLRAGRRSGGQGWMILSVIRRRRLIGLSQALQDAQLWYTTQLLN